MSQPDLFLPSKNRHHDIFISYAHLDKPIADAICAKLEFRHLRCWIAPRDVSPGKNFPEAIIDGIEESKVFILVFSSHANNSQHVLRELTNAVNKGRIVIPFRLEEVIPSKSMEYLISVPHWLDAINPPLEKHIDELASIIERILLSGKELRVCPACRVPISSNGIYCGSCGTTLSPGPPAPLKESDTAAPQPASPAVFPPVSEPSRSQPLVQPPPPPVTALPAPAPDRRMLFIAAGVVIVVVGLLYFALPIPFGTIIGGSVNNSSPTPVTIIDYRSENAPINRVVLTTAPTQSMPKDTELFIEVDKDSTNAMVTIQFAGGPGLGRVMDNTVILTRSDGTEARGKLDFNQRSSEIMLQGTRGTDRLQVEITQYSGATYIIVDKLLPYRERG